VHAGHVGTPARMTRAVATASETLATAARRAACIRRCHPPTESSGTSPRRRARRSATSRTDRNAAPLARSWSASNASCCRTLRGGSPAARRGTARVPDQSLHTRRRLPPSRKEHSRPRAAAARVRRATRPAGRWKVACTTATPAKRRVPRRQLTSSRIGGTIVDAQIGSQRRIGPLGGALAGGKRPRPAGPPQALVSAHQAVDRYGPTASSPPPPRGSSRKQHKSQSSLRAHVRLA
jgi:hypothetical protein